MQKRTFALALALCLSATAAFAANGKQVFQDSGCTMCHKEKEDSTGPSLVRIASEYAKSNELGEFFAGAAKPRVDPDKFEMMKPNLPKIQALSKEDRDALMDYILSQK